MNIIFVNIVISDDYVSLIQYVKIYFNIIIFDLYCYYLPTFVIKKNMLCVNELSFIGAILP